MAKGKYKKIKKNIIKSNLIDKFSLGSKNNEWNEKCISENILENHTVNYDNTFKYSINLLFTSCILIIFTIILIAIVPIYLKSIPKIYYTIISPVGLLCMISLYYANIWRINKSFESLKSIILNFISTIGLYNILMITNLSSLLFDMESLSSDYVISNVFLFYISFLIISFEYNNEKKFFFIIDCYYGLLTYMKTNKIKSFITFSLFIWVISLFILYKELKTLLGLLSIIIFMFLFQLTKFNIDYKKRHIESRKAITKYSEYTDKFIKWIFDVFKTERIREVPLMSENGKIEKINISIVIFTKFILLFFFIVFYKTNIYYILYIEENKGYCENNESINEETEIIKLKNGNVLVITGKGSNLDEIECKKSLKRITFNFNR